MSDEKITAAGEEAARSHILGLVADYCDKYHNKKGPFEEGQRIPYASRVYDSSEMVNLVDSALEFWLTSGRYTDRFEKGLAGYLGVRYFSQSDRVYDSDLQSAGGAESETGRRGDYSGRRFPHNRDTADSVWSCPCVCGCDDSTV